MLIVVRSRPVGSSCEPGMPRGLMLLAAMNSPARPEDTAASTLNAVNIGLNITICLSRKFGLSQVTDAEEEPPTSVCPNETKEPLSKNQVRVGIKCSLGPVTTDRSS